MSDSFYQLALALVMGAALLVQIGFAGYYIHQRDWDHLGRLGLLFLGWLLIPPILFLIGVGICAAGCPGEPFEFVLFSLVCTPSIFIVYKLFKGSRAHPSA
jgi:hypothetical protein